MKVEASSKMMNRIKKDQMPQTGLQEVQAENIRATSRPI